MELAFVEPTPVMFVAASRPGVYDQIAPAFDELAQVGQRDEARLAIEFYRRRDTIDLLLPVAR